VEADIKTQLWEFCADSYGEALKAEWFYRGFQWAVQLMDDTNFEGKTVN
jgi:hypothetical protein